MSDDWEVITARCHDLGLDLFRSGPGTVTFSASTAAVMSVSFSAPGTQCSGAPTASDSGVQQERQRDGHCQCGNDERATQGKRRTRPGHHAALDPPLLQGSASDLWEAITARSHDRAWAASVDQAP